MKIRRSVALQTVLVLLVVLVVVNIGVTVFLWGKVCPNENIDCEIKYTLYIGLNDKDTYKQEIPEGEAKDIVENVCMQYADGYTVQDAVGMWVDENQNATHEKTIVCLFYDTDEETIYRIADELRIQLNQNSILIEKDEVRKEYYTGNADNSQ